MIPPKGCRIEYVKYKMGGTCIIVKTPKPSEQGDVYCYLTTWIPGLEKDEVAVKDYSENEGMLNWAIENKLVEPPHRFQRSGFINIPICKILKQ